MDVDTTEAIYYAKQIIMGEFREELIALLKKYAPPRGRLLITNLHYISVKEICGGMDDMYRCSLPLNHSGQCWTDNKKVDFDPINFSDI